MERTELAQRADITGDVDTPYPRDGYTGQVYNSNPPSPAAGEANRKPSQTDITTRSFGYSDDPEQHGDPGHRHDNRETSEPVWRQHTVGDAGNAPGVSGSRIPVDPETVLDTVDTRLTQPAVVPAIEKNSPNVLEFSKPSTDHGDNPR